VLGTLAQCRVTRNLFSAQTVPTVSGAAPEFGWGMAVEHPPLDRNQPLGTLLCGTTLKKDHHLASRPRIGINRLVWLSTEPLAVQAIREAISDS
jgi:hypothetical protein